MSNPRARNLDTGDDLKWEVLKGDAITKAKLDVKNVTPQSEIVVFRFAPVKAGESIRLRMFETYTDTARYKMWATSSCGIGASGGRRTRWCCRPGGC